MHHFTHLTEDIYQLLVCGSDLLILNSDWDFAHIDALMLNTPTLVFGNSIQQELQQGEKILTSTFQPDPVLYHMVQFFTELNKNSLTTPLFQFTSFPIKQTELPASGLQQGIPPYHLADMFNDMETIPLLKQLICDANYFNEYQKLCNKYLQDHKALTMAHIIHKILEEGV